MKRTKFFKVGTPLPTNFIISKNITKCKEKSYKCWLDSKSFEIKPAGSEYHLLNKRFKNSLKIEHKFEEIQKAISEGRTIVPANLKTKDNKYIARKNQYFINTELLLLDFDNGYTIQEAIEDSKRANIKPALIYKTMSHKADHHKFRMMYIFNEPLSAEQYKTAFKVLSYIHNNQNDSQAKDLARLFLGTNKESGIVYSNESNIINFEDLTSINYKVNTAKKEQEAAKIESRLNSIDKAELNTLTARFRALEPVKDFEAGNWDRAGGYEWIRSMMFVYDKLGIINDFFNAFKKHYPDWLEDWKYYYKYDLDNQNGGHIHTSKILYEIGFFSYATDNLNMYKGKEIELENKYIDQSSIKEIFESIDSGDKTLITAPTGTGKTYSVLNYAKKYGKKLIFLAPYQSTTWQTVKNYAGKNIVGFWGKNKVNLTGKEQIIIATYDKSAQIKEQISKNDYTLVIDEAHNLVGQYDFRRKAMINVRKLEQLAESVVHITATPVGLKPDYNKIYNFKADKVLNKANIVNGKRLKDLLSLVIENKKPDHLDIIRINNKKKQQQIKDTLINNGKYKKDEILILNSDRKNIDDFKKLVEFEKVDQEYKLLLTTSLIDDGVNIQNQNINNIYFYGSLDFNALVQFPNRNRQGFNEMYIFKKLKDDKQNFNLQKRFNYLYDKAKKEVVIMNNIHSEAKKMKNKKTKDLIKGFDDLLQPDFVRFDYDNQLYVVDEKKILCKIYKQLSGVLSNIEVMKKLLKEYANFEDIQLIEKVETVPIEEAEQRDYTSELQQILKDNSVSKSCFLNIAARKLSLDGKDLPDYLVKEEKTLIKKYANLDQILQDQKRNINKIIKMFKTLFYAKKEKEESIFRAIDLYLAGVRPNTLYHKVQAGIAFRNPDLLRSIEKNKLKQLEELEGKEYTNKQLRNIIKNIIGKDIKYSSRYLQKFFEIEKKRTRINGSRKRVIKIKNKVDLNNIYGIEFIELINSKDLQNIDNTVKKCLKVG